MTISTSTPRRRLRHATRRTALACAAVAALSASVLTGAVLVGPATPAGADPGNLYNWQDFTVNQFYNPNGDTPPITGGDQLLTGSGTGCPPPDPLPAHNAGDGSGKGYQVPFVIGLTNGRTYIGHSINAEQHGQFPFITAIYGITGWVRGWVDLPSVKIEIPAGGLQLCNKQAVVVQLEQQNLTDPEHQPVDGSACTPTPCGTFTSIADSPSPDSFFQTLSDMSVVGTPTAQVSGVDSRGALEFNAGLSVHVSAGVSIGGFATQFQCQATAQLDFGTGPEQLITRYATNSAQNPYPRDPAYWADQTWNVAAVTPPFAPPQKNYLPTRELNSATTGGSAVAGSVSFAIPQMGPGPGGEACEPARLAVLSLFMAPLDPRFGYPIWAIPEGDGSFNPATMPSDYSVPFGEAMEPGSGQSSVELHLDDLGIKSGLPAGYGFSG